MHDGGLNKLLQYRSIALRSKFLVHCSGGKTVCWDEGLRFYKKAFTRHGEPLYFRIGAFRVLGSAVFLALILTDPAE